MAQDYIKINGVKIWQPDCDIAVALETTYTQGSTRAQSGKGKFTPMFTVERMENCKVLCRTGIGHKNTNIGEKQREII